MAAIFPSLPASEQLRPSAQKSHLRSSVLFGSAARGGTYEESHFDIGVLTEHFLHLKKK